jgi:hypothetical protein
MAIAVLLLCWCLVLAVALLASESLARGFLISGIASSILLPLALRTAQQPLDILEPIIPASLAFLVMFVARPIADQVTSKYNHLGFDINPTFDEALFIVLVGCLAFNVGYLSNNGARFSPRFLGFARRFPERRVVIAGATTAGVGVGVYSLFLMSKGGIASLLVFLGGRSQLKFDLERSSSGYLYGTIYFLMPATMMLYAAWLRYRRTYILFFAGLAGVPIFAYEMAQGDRSQMLPLLLGLPTIYYLYRRRRPTLRSLALPMTLLFLTFAFLREFRNSESAGRRDVESLVSRAPADTLADTFTKDDDEMFDTIANIVSIVPGRIPYQPLGLVSDLAVRALPRVLYPRKPLEVTDQFVVALWPMHYQRSRASAASSLFGTFYLYGGILGVALGGFATGALLRQLWRWFIKRAQHLNAIVLYAFVPSFTIIALRGTISDTLTRMFFVVLPMLVAQSYWCRSGE